MTKSQTKYKPDDLLTIEQAADHLGYSDEYLRGLNAKSNPNGDPLFRRMRIKTDPTWRQAFECSAHYVYRYGDLMAWFHAHQDKATVQIFNEGRGIIVE